MRMLVTVSALDELPLVPQIIRRWLRPAEVKLAALVATNPYYPFTRDEQGVYKMTVRYKLLYLAIIGIIASAVTILSWTFTGHIQSNTFFLFPFYTLIISIIVIPHFRAKRIYILDQNDGRYMFLHGKTLMTEGKLHNVYVRLRREKHSVSAAGRKNAYNLIFNGYQIDSRQISGTSTNLQAMREIGQRIAASLEINYFDESNISEHHVVRHLRDQRQPPTNLGGASMR